jgi:GntR family transcriptional regulator
MVSAMSASPEAGGGFVAELMPVDPEAGPVLAQAADAVVRAIGASGAAPGQRLPTERQLAHLLRVSRTTLRQALGQLERDGLIARRPGRNGGTFVNVPKLDRDLRLTGGLPEVLRSQGHSAGARVLRTLIAPADAKDADALGILPGNPVYEITRVRLADGEPISLERSRFPCELFPGLLECPLGDSLYEVLRERYDAAPARAVERVEAVLASSQEAEALDVFTGAPLLWVERIAYDADGRAVEVGTDLFRGDRTRVVTWTHRDADDAAAFEQRLKTGGAGS